MKFGMEILANTKYTKIHTRIGTHTITGQVHA